MKKIVYIADPEILAIPISENHEPMINIKDCGDLLYGPPPETELTKPHYTKLRKTVFDKICLAQKDLPNNWRFRIYEGYRSIEVQEQLFEYEYQRFAKQMPGKTHAEIFHETTRLVSPVTNLDGSANIPAHNTGGAVDIEIIDEKSKLIDMGMTAKDWIDVDAEYCMTDCKLISEIAQQHRQILCEIMQAHDFVNYPTEWWHFSYGDRYWAYHKDQAQAMYGSADELSNGLN